jgi:hypothetical protein
VFIAAPIVLFERDGCVMRRPRAWPGQRRDAI